MVSPPFSAGRCLGMSKRSTWAMLSGSSSSSSGRSSGKNSQRTRWCLTKQCWLSEMVAIADLQGVRSSRSKNSSGQGSEVMHRRQNIHMLADGQGAN